ncbi:hypothetical protein HMPREF9018_1284 [Prevotella amnii CRIS 21A-A]|uniref:Uncharacterized protein n=1 Tax=Prevotella amnii CRIS 21A-A TaxID=679191 RepID=E1GXH2_9BACT|nr:hypothetical protein HMPREF9018_1284 [Prevotella amnii CRIS 21A-A]
MVRATSIRDKIFFLSTIYIILFLLSSFFLLQLYMLAKIII